MFEIFKRLWRYIKDRYSSDKIEINYENFRFVDVKEIKSIAGGIANKDSLILYSEDNTAIKIPINELVDAYTSNKDLRIE